MSFKFENTEISGLIIIDSHTFYDKRGIYRKCFEKNIFFANGINVEFTETSDIYSRKGALRGLHYQEKYSQAKLVHIIKGALFDVALDLRKDSPTFGKYHTELLSSDNSKTIFIPEGFAHGFIALEDDTIFSYQCSGKYDPDSSNGILWNDKILDIKWPLKEYDIHEVLITEKDRNWQTFSEYVEKINK